MQTYRIFVPMPTDHRFGSFYTTQAKSVEKAFSNIHFRIYGKTQKHYYIGWKYEVKNNTSYRQPIMSM